VSECVCVCVCVCVTALNRYSCQAAVEFMRLHLSSISKTPGSRIWKISGSDPFASVTYLEGTWFKSRLQIFYPPS